MSALDPACVARAFEAACHAELAALKPGNVHIHAAGHGMAVAQFEQAAAAAAPAIAGPGTRVGERIRAAVEASLAVAGCNTNLGIILLCAPLAAAAEAPGPEDLRTRLAAVLDGLDVADARAAFHAIAAASPGGLGDAPEADVKAPAAVTLAAAMALAADRDLIARQYGSAYQDIFALGLPALRETADRGEAAPSPPRRVQELPARQEAAQGDESRPPQPQPGADHPSGPREATSSIPPADTGRDQAGPGGMGTGAERPAAVTSGVVSSGAERPATPQMPLGDGAADALRTTGDATPLGAPPLGDSGARPAAEGKAHPPEPVGSDSPCAPARVEAAYLAFLCAFPDSHIARKFGPETAEAVRVEAQAVRAGLPGLDPPARHARLMAFDAALKARGLNPGTSADLTVATVFAALLERDPIKLNQRSVNHPLPYGERTPAPEAAGAPATRPEP